MFKKKNSVSCKGSKKKPSLKEDAMNTLTRLQEDFSPIDSDVICGRGRRCFNHRGNVKFRNTILAYLTRYKAAETKAQKSNIICEIIDLVRKDSPNGGFVKKDEPSGRWFEVGNFLAREKVSQAFRDVLHDQYRSSNIAKNARRRSEQRGKPSSNQVVQKLEKAKPSLHEKLDPNRKKSISSRNLIANEKSRLMANPKVPSTMHTLSHTNAQSRRYVSMESVNNSHVAAGDTGSKNVCWTNVVQNTTTKPYSDIGGYTRSAMNLGLVLDPLPPTHSVSSIMEVQPSTTELFGRNLCRKLLVRSFPSSNVNSIQGLEPAPILIQDLEPTPILDGRSGQRNGEMFPDLCDSITARVIDDDDLYEPLPLDSTQETPLFSI